MLVVLIFVTRQSIPALIALTEFLLIVVLYFELYVCASQPTTKPRSEQRHPLLCTSSYYLQQCEKILSCSVTSCQLGTCLFRLVTSCSCAELRSCSCPALRRWGGATVRLTRKKVTGNGFSAVMPVPLLMLAGDWANAASIAEHGFPAIADAF